MLPEGAGAGHEGRKRKQKSLIDYCSEINVQDAGQPFAGAHRCSGPRLCCPHRGEGSRGQNFEEGVGVRVWVEEVGVG